MTYGFHALSFLRRALLNLLIVLGILLAPATAFGQTVTGNLEVSVSDPSGGTIPGANITLTNDETGFSVNGAADSNGEARFANLPVGRYSVLISAPAFKNQTKEVEVVSGEARKLAVTLEVAAISTEKATATSTSSAATAAASAGEEVRDELSALPNLNNDLTPILQVVPGAIPIGPTALGRIIFDGKEQQTNWLDGMDVTPLVDLPSGDSAIGILDGFLKPSVGVNPSTVTPRTGAFAPIYGPGTGSVVEGTTFSATTEWRFQFYERILNDALNARNYFDFEGKNGLRRNVFGAQGGGPIYRNRAFLFIGYEGTRGRTERNVYEAVPADALCLCGGGPVAPLLGGFLPPGTAIMTGATASQDFLVARRRVRTTSGANAWDARLDFNLSSKDLLTLRYTHQSAEARVPDGVTGRRQHQRLRLANGLVNLTLLRSNYTHVLRLGFNRTQAHVNTEVGDTTDLSLLRSAVTLGAPVDTIGLPLQFQSVPTASLGGLAKSIGGGFDLDPTSIIAGYDFSGDFKNGMHKLQFGGETRFIRLRYDRLGGLTYSFPNVAALRAGTPGGITFLSDLSGESLFGNGVGPRHARQQFHMGYFQLTTRFGIRSEKDAKLTLTYGLRYDYFGPVRERDGRAMVVDPQTGEVLPPGASFYRAQKNNFEPRFSLAYHILSNRGPFADMVLRVGAGVYSGAPRTGDLLLPIDSNRIGTGITDALFPATTDDLTRGFFENLLTRQAQPLAFARDFTTPERVYKWEASLTPKFWGVYNFGISYFGNVGRNLPIAGIANPIVSVITNPDPTKQAIVLRRFDIVRNGQVFKPFGEFFYRTSTGHSSYNAMSISFSRDSEAKQEDIGLPDWLVPKSFSMQYTLARSVGNVTGAVASNPSDFNSDYGYNSTDARHSFTLQMSYRLWEAFSADRPKSSLLWGWAISPKITATSGLPLVVLLDRPDVVYRDGSGNVFSSPGVGRHAFINTPGGGSTSGSRVPDLIPGVNPYLRNGLELLNPEAFAIPRPGSFGNLGRGALRGPGRFKVDLALMRQLFSKETKSAEMKIEFFNIFNRANFINPAASLQTVLGTSSADNQLQPGQPFTRLAAKTFGIYSAAETGRLIQFTLTFKFNNGFF